MLILYKTNDFDISEMSINRQRSARCGSSFAPGYLLQNEQQCSPEAGNLELTVKAEENLIAFLFLESNLRTESFSGSKWNWLSLSLPNNNNSMFWFVLCVKACNWCILEVHELYLALISFAQKQIGL